MLSLQDKGSINKECKNSLQQQQQIQQNSISHLCKDCFRTFKDINNYKEHRFQEHQATEFPNVRKCSMCSYATLLKSKYDCHMRCHLNNKVIRCNRCDYSTINIRHMSRHERMHMISSSIKTECFNSSSMGLLSHSNNNNNNKAKYIKKLKNDSINNAKIKLNKKRKLILNDNNKINGVNQMRNDDIEQISQPNEKNEDSYDASNGDLNSQNKPINLSFELIKNLITQFDKTKTFDASSNNNNNSLNNLNNANNINNEYANEAQCYANLASHSSNLITPPSSASSTSSLASSPNSSQKLINSITPPLPPIHSHQFNLHKVPVFEETNLIGNPSSYANHLPLPPSHPSHASLSQHHFPYPQHQSQIQLTHNQHNQFQHYYMPSALSTNELYKKNLENILRLQNMCPNNFNIYSQSPLFCSLLTTTPTPATTTTTTTTNSSSYPSSSSSPVSNKIRSHQIENLISNQTLLSEKFGCENASYCKHKTDLEYLRRNVFKILSFLMPQIIPMFNLDLDSIETTSEIDKLIDYLINNNNNNNNNNSNNNSSNNISSINNNHNIIMNKNSNK